VTLWNVKVRTKFYNFKKPDGGKTNEWTFQQEAPTAKRAGRIVLDAIFGGKTAAELFCKGVEIWPAAGTKITGLGRVN
jgi:hypothetical protein